MRHDVQSNRYDLGKVLSQTNNDRVKVGERVLGRVRGPEQLFKIRSARMHRREEELILASESLIEDRFGNAGGLRDLPRRGRMSQFAEDVARDPEHFVIGDRFLTPHTT